MKFVPADQGLDEELPWADEARAVDGWKGQSTDKSVAKLRGEISTEIGRLKGTMTRWMRGDFEGDDGRVRAGIQIGYSVSTQDGKVWEGRIDVAALPHKTNGPADRVRARADKALRAALYNVRDALQSNRILQDLSPGYVGLMPWLLTEGDKTISQLWGSKMGYKALPAPDKDGDIVDVKFREVDE